MNVYINIPDISVRTASFSLFFFYQRAQGRKLMNCCIAEETTVTHKHPWAASSTALPCPSPLGGRFPLCCEAAVAGCSVGHLLPALNPARDSFEPHCCNPAVFIWKCLFQCHTHFGRFLRMGRIFVIFSITLSLSFTKSLPSQDHNLSQSTS